MTMMMTPLALRDSGACAVQSRGVAAKPRPEADSLAVWVLLYLVCAAGFLLAVGVDPALFLATLPQAFLTFFALAQVLVPWWGGLALAAVVLSVGPLRRRLWQQKVKILSSILLCGVFTMMFTTVKSHLPQIAPFWADAFLTRADLAVHFGQSPHDLLGWMAPLHTGQLLGFYFNGWVFFATFLPVLLIAFDGDASRRRVFTHLWLLCWVVLGNLLAVAVMSYGPIFADLFPGGPAKAHQGALSLLERADAGALMFVKMRLWQAYTGESGMLASGISAFPSVHVGMATVLGLYLARVGADIARSGRLPPPLGLALVVAARLVAGLYVLVYLLLSVYLGWHYALDGYASILLMGLCYWLLSRREPRVGAEKAMRSA